ncbi:MAG: molecular chaperone DnaJ [Hyphomonadaceae bacterium]|nr:molecular chaperone DnaJ [Hyphomonadaceae bacterium]
MSSRDYYEILGVQRGAEAAAIKSAYRKLAMQYHPDQNPGDKAAEDKFKEINEAYAALSDPEKRAQYDRFGKAAFEGAQGPGGYQDFSDIFNEVFGDAFGDLFGGGGRGGGRRPNGPERGGDLRYDIEITLEQAFSGLDREIVVPREMACEVCTGAGAEPGTHPETCSTCAGSGQVRASQGMFRVVRTCHTCGGRGTIVRSPCKACSGRGRVKRERTLSVKIPPGVEDGTRIRLSGEGDLGGRGGPPGDLYLFLSVRAHKLFERDGMELFCRIPVPMTKAALGGDIEVPTIDGGKQSLTIVSGAQTGRRFRLKHQGMPRLQGRANDRGDLHVEIFVETPMNLTAKQKKLLHEFAAESGVETDPQTHGFFDMMKRFFEGGGETPGR